MFTQSNTKRDLDRLLENNCVKTDGFAFAGTVGGVPTLFLHSIKGNDLFINIAINLARFGVRYCHYIFNKTGDKLFVDNNGDITRNDDLCNGFCIGKLFDGIWQKLPLQIQFPENKHLCDIDFIYFGKKEIVLIDAKTSITSLTNYHSAMRSQSKAFERQFKLANTILLNNIKRGGFWVVYAKNVASQMLNEVYPLQIIYDDNGYYTFDLLNTESVSVQNFGSWLIETFGVSWI